MTIITFNRIKVKNCIGPVIHAELVNAFDHFRVNDEAKVAMITGAGDSAGIHVTFGCFSSPAKAQPHSLLWRSASRRDYSYGQSKLSGANDDAPPHSPASVRITWVSLLKRVFDTDIECCPHFGKNVRIIAAI